MNLGSLSNKSCGDTCLSCIIYDVITPMLEEPPMDDMRDHDRAIAAKARDALSECIRVMAALTPANAALDDLIQDCITHMRTMRQRL